ncbi:hypothetical protein [Novosphingobium sp.]|uniref:hypothetical protein n=1 Tax=Novosphingobium sp. TaxID=1874826 RepID=UPI0028A98BF4|nr:hypothetical protein [Novosphingobium sp.]
MDLGIVSQWAALAVGTVGICSGAVAIVSDGEVPPEIINLLRIASAACLAVCGILFLV